MLPTGVGPAARLETGRKRDHGGGLEGRRLVVCAARIEFVDAVREAIAESVDELRRRLPWARSIPHAGEPDPDGRTVAAFTEFCAMFERGESYTYVAFEESVPEKPEKPEKRESPETAGTPDIPGVPATLVRAVGSASLKRTVAPDAFEIGYWIRSDCTGRGLATEVAGTLVRAAFDLHGARRLELITAVDNPASARVAEKLGFVREATLRERHPNPDGTFADVHLHSLFRIDYPRSPAARLPLSAFDATGARIL